MNFPSYHGSLQRLSLGEASPCGARRPWGVSGRRLRHVPRLECSSLHFPADIRHSSHAHVSVELGELCVNSPSQARKQLGQLPRAFVNLFLLCAGRGAGVAVDKVAEISDLLNQSSRRADGTRIPQV